MSWRIEYTVRPADRRDAGDAHEVRMMNGKIPIRVVGVWDAKHKAEAVAAALNQWSGGQIR